MGHGINGDKGDEGFNQEQADQSADDQERVIIDHRKIEPHPDRHEKETKEKAFKGGQVHLYLMFKLCLTNQQTGDESAETKREARICGSCGRTNDGEKC